MFTIADNTRPARTKRWSFLFAVAFAATGGAVDAGAGVLPACPGGDRAGPEQFRDGCQARVRYNTGVYIGEFRNNSRDGEGVWIYANGAKYAGPFKEGKPSGRGTYTYPDGTKYVGEFRDGKFNGAGVLYSASGAVTSSGYFADDRYVGPMARAEENAPPSPNAPPAPMGQKSIRLSTLGDHNLVPITLNGLVTIDAIIDSGADALVIPADVFSRLESNHTISAQDYLGTTKVVVASGAQSDAKVVRIHSLKVGEVKVNDVVAVVGTKQSPTLLGQTFLRKFKSWSIDNRRHTLDLD